MPVSVESVWNEFAVALRRYIAARVSDEPTADDILQEVFLKIHTHIGDLHDGQRLQGWVYRIAQNAISDHYRRSRAELLLPDDLPAAEPEPVEDPEARLAQSLRAMAQLLPERYREAVMLDAFEGVPQAEIARRLHLSLSGAKSRVQRGREQLRDLLLACCHVEFDRRGRVMDYVPRVNCCVRCDERCAPAPSRPVRLASFPRRARQVKQTSIPERTSP